MESITSCSLLYFFRKHSLPNEIEVCFNSTFKDDKCWIIQPIKFNKNYYHFYIQLNCQINGYDKVVLSRSAVDYIKYYPERINNLRVRLYPWPEIVCPFRKNIDAPIYSEVDSISDVMLRFEFHNDLEYEKPVPRYEQLVFSGFRRIEQFDLEKTITTANGLTDYEEGYFYDPENKYK